MENLQELKELQELINGSNLSVEDLKNIFKNDIVNKKEVKQIETVKTEVKKESKGTQLVQPIRCKDQLNMLKKELYKKNDKYGLLFSMGINVGLRISDLLKLKVGDVRGNTHIPLKETKTKKNRRVMINSKLRKEIDVFIKGKKDSEFLFKSNKGENKAISRIQAYRILNDTADLLGIPEVGTHTLRKTFGYMHYQQYKDVAILQDLFNHSSPSVTLRYIGITAQEVDATIEDFYI